MRRCPIGADQEADGTSHRLARGVGVRAALDGGTNGTHHASNRPIDQGACGAGTVGGGDK
jgi:hypothetical protein